MRKDAQNTSKSQAEIHKISTVEPFGIVYAAVLVSYFYFYFHLYSYQLLHFTDSASPLLHTMGCERFTFRLSYLYRSTVGSFQRSEKPLGPKVTCLVE